jgi:ferredoxin
MAATKEAKEAKEAKTTRETLVVNPIDCTGHGVCAELLPELIHVDEWGYPIVDPRPVPAELVREARRAVAACPALALKLMRR